MKTFLVTMEDAPDTKWLWNDAMVAETLQYCAASYVSGNTTGPRPLVKCHPIKPSDLQQVRKLLVALEEIKPAPKMDEKPPTLAFLKPITV